MTPLGTISKPFGCCIIVSGTIFNGFWNQFFDLEAMFKLCLLTIDVVHTRSLTLNHQPTANHQQPAADNPQLRANSPQPTARSQQPTAKRVGLVGLRVAHRISRKPYDNCITKIHFHQRLIYLLYEWAFSLFFLRSPFNSAPSRNVLGVCPLALFGRLAHLERTCGLFALVWPLRG